MLMRPCVMQGRLLLLFVVSCVASTGTLTAEDADDAEWGIFAALRHAQSAGDTSLASCSCCQEVQDLRRRIAALEHGFSQIAGQEAKSLTSRCPSLPDVAAASAAAESAEPTLARMTAIYCSEWVRAYSTAATPAHACRLPPDTLSLRLLKRVTAIALTRSLPAPRTSCSCWASCSAETALPIALVSAFYLILCINS
jgi:hypothetical protein